MNIYFQTVQERGLWSKAICNQSFFSPSYLSKRLAQCQTSYPSSCLSNRHLAITALQRCWVPFVAGCERNKIPTFIFASECIRTTQVQGIFLQSQEGKVCFFHHTFKSELSLRAQSFVSVWAARSWLHTLISEEPECTKQICTF